VLALNNRQDQPRRVFIIVVDGLMGKLDTPFLP
jgi:hypothetical protein